MARANKGRARRRAILSLIPPGRIRIDVGCGDGRIAEAINGIATERALSLLPANRADCQVVADGLTAFRRADVVIIAGLGSSSILRILENGPRPAVGAVLHSPEKTARLRQGLADRGFRIDAEVLAPEGNGFAEVIRAVPGRETASGYRLWFGPHLCADPLVVPHARRLRRIWNVVAREAPAGSRSRVHAVGWLNFLQRILQESDRHSSFDSQPGAGI